jgi:hypothetical protein
VLGVLLRMLLTLPVVPGLAVERLALGIVGAGSSGEFLRGVRPLRLVQPFRGVLLRSRDVSAVGLVTCCQALACRVLRTAGFRMLSLRGTLPRLRVLLPRIPVARTVILGALSGSVVLSHGTSFHPRLH